VRELLLADEIVHRLDRQVGPRGQCLAGQHQKLVAVLAAERLAQRVRGESDQAVAGTKSLDAQRAATG
jgi:hypothetical protein